MEIVANDLVVQSRFQDIYSAVQEIKNSIEILKILKKSTNFQRLSSKKDVFKNWEIAPNYFIEQLFNDQSGLLNKDEKLFLITMLTNFRRIQYHEDVFQFNKLISSQCAWAYLNHAMLFSIPVDERWSTEKLVGVLKKGDKDIEVEISNIAYLEHVKIHEQQLQMWKYEFNKKHAEKYGWGTVMDLTDTDAQELLLKAVSLDNTYKHLGAKKNGKYYSFRRHHENCYHGYWDDTMQEKCRIIVDKHFRN